MFLAKKLSVISVSLLLSLPSIVGAEALRLQDLDDLAEPLSQTVIYTARKFITMNPAKPTADAIAIRDGKFVAVGNLDEVSVKVGKDAYLDQSFDGKVVMPGFVEQHVHPVLAALAMNMTVISIEDWDTIDGFSAAVRDEKSYRTRLIEALTTHKDKTKPFITWGYHHYFHGEM